MMSKKWTYTSWISSPGKAIQTSSEIDRCMISFISIAFNENLTRCLFQELTKTLNTAVVEASKMCMCLIGSDRTFFAKFTCTWYRWTVRPDLSVLLVYQTSRWPCLSSHPNYNGRVSLFRNDFALSFELFLYITQLYQPWTRVIHCTYLMCIHV